MFSFKDAMEIYEVRRLPELPYRIGLGIDSIKCKLKFKMSIVCIDEYEIFLGNT